MLLVTFAETKVTRRVGAKPRNSNWPRIFRDELMGTIWVKADLGLLGRSVFIREMLAKGVGQVDEFLEDNRFGTAFGIDAHHA